MEIIQLSREDFSLWSDQIEGLFNSSVKINFPNAEFHDYYGRDKCKDVIRFLEDGSAIIFAAVEGEELAGWVWCHQIKRMDGPRIHVAEIAVVEKWHRRGIGSQLLKRVEMYAVENGYNEIDLLVTASNRKAVEFYQKANYTPERYLMKKNITEIYI